MKIPSVTNKEKEILHYLYQYRFLTTTHLQKLLTHKNPNRTLSWLNNLINKNCVHRLYDPKTFAENNKPAIYYLAPKARHILSQEKDIPLLELDYIYSEHRREEKFIAHSLLVADISLFLQNQTAPGETLQIFMKNQLRGYEYFPDPRPDAFIAVKDSGSTKRYFLDVFDDFTPTFVIRQRVRNYLAYFEHSDWDENTDHALFPSILFVCPNKRTKKHILLYSKAVLDKNLDNILTLFVTAKEEISNKSQEIWEKVS